MGNLDDVIQKDGRKTKSFALNKLFNVSTARGGDAGALSLKKEPFLGGVRFVGRTDVNNGIQGYVSPQGLYVNDAYSFSVSQVGTVTAKFHDSAWVGSQNMFCLDLKPEYKAVVQQNENIYLYLLTVIQRNVLALYSNGYTNYPTLKSLQVDEIDLPVDRAGNPDWGFIEAYINDVKEAYINEIHDYLALEGFAAYEDTILTDDEAAMLARDVETKPFRVGELFGDDLWASVPQAKSQSDVVTVDPLSDDAVQYVVQSLSNNMTSRFVSCESVLMNDYKIMTGKRIALGVTLPAVSYQPRAFTGSQLITLDVSDYSEDVSLYLVTHFRKHSQLFSYGNKPGLAKYKDLVFDLPVDSNNDPDWDYMAAYIRAVKKLSIRSTRQRMDTELEAYATINA